MTYRTGIDIGSVTAKVVMLDPQGRLAFSAYRRHRADAWATLRSILQEAQDTFGSVDATTMITGSAGMGVSERYGIPFVQEVIASARVVRQMYPQVRTLIDIGGEDAKLIHFGDDGIPDMRMNGTCAGGTGAYIDEMAALLHIPVSDLSALAEQHKQIYPMASRCGVFAKTDVQNLLARQADRADIAASILHAVVLQTLTTLARGLDLKPLLLFSGGPLTFLPALRRAFMTELRLQPQDILRAPHLELMPAMGAALAADGTGQVRGLAELLHALGASQVATMGETRRLAPLFTSGEDRRDWEAARSRHRVVHTSLEQMADEPCFLGVDSGSTTTKIVVTDSQGRVAFTHYAPNNGKALEAAQQGLQKLQDELAVCPTPPWIARTAATGYGEDLMRAALGLDDGMVETVAHFRGARAFDPEVSFILDIGGQDMKAIFVEDGHIKQIELNEACSSGCGTFIQTYASSMGYGLNEFVQKACAAEAPCDLGTRCTVFMNSRIKQALKEAADVGDIAAGLAYSVCKNALHKVLRITDTSILGTHIVVQGGAFRNSAIHRALEQLLGRAVVCPEIAELMGAYGAALAARDAWLDETCRASRFVGLEALAEATSFEVRNIRCRGCPNRCDVAQLHFLHGGVFYTGNRCERIYSNRGAGLQRGTSITDVKLKLLFDQASASAAMPRMTIGIPRVLNIFDSLPFWNALLVECGFKVQLSDPSTSALYAKGAGSIMSENICFPAKLVHGHIENLIEKRVDRILYPMVLAGRDDFCNAVNSFQCPIVTGYADVVRSAIDPHGRHGIPLDTPILTFRDEKLLRKACEQYLRSLGVDRAIFRVAFQRAIAAQREYEQAVRTTGARIVEAAQREDRLVVLLIGRPYHLDSLINHGVPQILVDLGVDVITEDALPLDGTEAVDNHYVPAQWRNVNYLYHAAHWACRQESVEVVQLNSFACGPDAYAIDEVKSILAAHGKSHTIIRIDEIESAGSMRLRLRSLVETLTARHRQQGSMRPRQQIKLFEASDRKKKILIPYFSRFCAPVVAGPLRNMGYNVETLPPPDRESVEIALRYTQNEICYPAIILIGDILKALQSGKYDRSEIAVGCWQTGGQCRATSMLSMIRKAMITAGYDDIPIVALTTNPRLHDQPGNNLNRLEYVPKALMACVYADAVSAMYYATAIRERDKGTAHALADRLMAPLIEGALPLDRAGTLALLEHAVQQFNAIPTTDRAIPAVGLLGEVYVKYNAFSNNDVAEWLMAQGVEVVVPDFLTFMLAGFVNIDAQVRGNLAQRNIGWLIARLLEWRVQSVIDQAQVVLRGFKHYRPQHGVRDVAHKAEEIMSLVHTYGEGWLIAGEVGTLVENGVTNFVCLSPFGCIANQIVARGVAKRMKERYHGLNLLFLDLDAGMSEVNYFNRLHFFVSQAKGA